MRCLSPFARYSIQVFEGKEQVVVDARGFAQSIVLEQPVIANFDKSGLLDWEIEAALTSFNFSGLPEGVNPLTRISVFDTEAYCQRFPKDRRDEMQVQIDARLRELEEINPSEFIVVDPPVKPKPWPSYDENKVTDILKFQEALQFSPEAIRLYEEENQNRPKIVYAMLQLEDPDGAEVYASQNAEALGLPATTGDGEVVATQTA